MIRRYFVVILLAVNTASFGQARDSAQQVWETPNHILKFSPFHLINFYPTLQLSYEQKLAHRITLQIEGGYVLDYEGNYNDDYQNKRGFKAKLEPRYYLGMSGRTVASYLSSELYMNRINFDRETTITGCFDQQCNFRYQQDTSYEMKYREHGVSVKMGMMIRFHRFAFDLNSGWTVRVIRYDGHPLGGGWGDDFIDGWDFEPNENDRVALSPNLGIRFGYRLK